MTAHENDEAFMRLALSLAEKGMGRTSPNPMVGAVIVKDGRIIGQGYHEAYGGLHAERNALLSCSESPEGADLYVTLEPCCHYGKQPPCTQAILEAGIRRVAVGCTDPNPLVAGKGIAFLSSHGIQVTEPVLEEACRKLNRIFFHYIRTKRPFVVLKYAMTLDGKTASPTGASQWITGEEARTHVHRQRLRCSAIMTGAGTVLADDPLLTCRIENGRNPIRIICDSSLRTPLDSRIVRTAREIPTIFAACHPPDSLQKRFEEAGCRVFDIPGQDGRPDMNALMERLGREGIDSILLEGGGNLNWAAVKSGIVNQVLAYISPKLLGGAASHTPVDGEGFSAISQALPLSEVSITPLGKDFLIQGIVRSQEGGDTACSQES